MSFRRLGASSGIAPVSSLFILALCGLGCTQASNPEVAPRPESQQSSNTPEATSVNSTETTQVPYDGPIHVAVSGADDANGSPASPLRTIEAALERVEPGDSIVISSGTYPPFEIRSVRDVEVRSAPGATVVVSAVDYPAVPGVHVLDSAGVTVTGLTIDGPLWGIMVEASNEVVISSNRIANLGQEGIMIRLNSFEVDVIDNHISLTGQKPGQNDGRPYSNFGEGIYLGSPRTLDDGSEDLTRSIRVAGNTISEVTAEAIDVKPWVDDVLIEQNHISRVDTATSGAIVVGIGNVTTDTSNVVIRHNVIHEVTRTSSFRDGNAVVVSAPATVTQNVIWNVQHYGILIDENLLGDGEVIVDGNVILGAGQEEIHVRAEPGSVHINIGQNTLGEAAFDVLGSTSPEAAFELVAILQEASRTSPSFDFE